MWFAWKFLSLWYQTQPCPLTLPIQNSCDLLENFYLCGIKHNYATCVIVLRQLWFAWKFLSLWYQTQRHIHPLTLHFRCDLLENFYLCGIKHNRIRAQNDYECVVICLKISIFVVSNTTHICKLLYLLLLWFAWKFLSLWYQTQQRRSSFIWSSVVICLKISIFVVSNTTDLKNAIIGFSCDLLENFYLCGIKHNISPSESNLPCVVICLKISIFVVSNTTC